ncbi:sporulation peptidase YabG [Thermincola ferriacetica]|uniref:Sporulation peptidase YabG n=1 Tax=Thermincola ferriacetica TaxID=281456 RepID=A0A0L6W145_9FIRM|nr:sporulation peptidase YabG [Thermincola ferriacetica]KNZ69191.1 sporulation peptidase YabG [Thermincola ferriacetica]
MPDFKKGDIVTRKSYNCDLYFQIVDFLPGRNGNDRVLLKGLDVRLCADCPVTDLQKVTRSQLKEYRKKFILRNNELLSRIYKKRSSLRPHLLRTAEADKANFFEIPGKVLHVDGNEDYLRLCEAMYSQLGLEAKGAHVPEQEQPKKIVGLLQEYQPDVLVLTGHDGFIKEKKDFRSLNSYRNSKYFVEAVKLARKFRPNKDDLIIVAGACQSHYEALLRAGANFASSPKRVFIHAFDPVFIVEKICFTSASQTVSINDVIDNTLTGINGLGGIETRGKHRWGFPKSPY